MLIVLAGLPGTGKTTIARELARQLGAVHIRIDSIEQAIHDSGVPEVNEAGYRVGYAVAEDNLRLGRTVIADSVNPLALTRDAWAAVATRSTTTAIEIEVMCSDVNEHRRRVETREIDIAGLKRPTWQDVVSRDYEPWNREPLLIDTGIQSLEQSIAAIMSGLPK